MSRKRILAPILCFVCFFSVMCMTQPVYAQTGTLTSTKLYHDIDAYLQACMESAHIPALSVTIVSEDAVLFSESYGSCESSDTPFFLGSVSKSFTAVCIMQMIEQGKISLNAPVSAYLPGATDGDRISVSQLLNHTSGLGQYQTLENYKIVNEQDVHHYANVNYSLLGEIIEAVSGESYSDYITDNLFEPLQLSHTAATLNGSVENGLMDGYTNYWGFNIKTSHQYPSSKDAWITVPAGYISSSTEDLGKYLQMYLNGGRGILSESSMDTMFYGDTAYVDGDIPYWYGYGWTRMEEPLSEPVLRHNGLVETGNACIFILPERKIAMAITANVNDYFVANGMIDSLGWGVVLMLLGNAPNDISGNAYVLNHLWIDLIMLAVLTMAIIPLCLLPKYVKRLKRGRILTKTLSLMGFHLLLPVFLLLLAPVFFKIPLWVVQAFAPDVFLTIVVSATLLFAGGLAKGILLYGSVFLLFFNSFPHVLLDPIFQGFDADKISPAQLHSRESWNTHQLISLPLAAAKYLLYVFHR